MIWITEELEELLCRVVLRRTCLADKQIDAAKLTLEEGKQEEMNNLAKRAGFWGNVENELRKVIEKIKRLEE